ncbi:MAG TPA: ribonuclease III [Clostridiales bacterium]|jgi:ribonuclease-3 family protein|nr:ribonuclease III [Clostridiales bacterium]
MEKELSSDINPMELNNNTMAFATYIRKALKISDTDIKTYSPLTLAYIGDAIFDLIIRTAMVECGNAPVNKLHKRVSKLVQASAQAELYHIIKEELTSEEEAVYKRGRNAKSYSSAKNAGVVEYRTATGLEALMGYLYLSDQMDRLMELIQPHFATIVNNI